MCHFATLTKKHEGLVATLNHNSVLYSECYVKQPRLPVYPVACFGDFAAFENRRFRVLPMRQSAAAAILAPSGFRLPGWRRLHQASLGVSNRRERSFILDFDLRLHSDRIDFIAFR
jgi:hypothetical protein